MRKVKVNRLDLEIAFEQSGDDTMAYLDIEEGTIVFVEDYATQRLEELRRDEDTLEAVETLLAQADLADWERESLLSAARVEWDASNRYCPVPRQDSHVEYRDMREYIWSLDDAHLREVLEVAVQGSGAFRRFKDVLHRYPAAQAQWFKFKGECQQQRMLDWFATERLEPEFE